MRDPKKVVPNGAETRCNAGLWQGRDGLQRQSMIRKSGNRFSLATNAEIMLKQRDEIMIRFTRIGS
jgi:hypothetical protein